MINAGELRQRVTIQAATVTQDEAGAPVETWADVATVWAAVEPLSGREYFAAQQVQSEVTHKIRMRWRAGVTTAHRIKFGERVFDIQAAINVRERGEELQVMAVERV